MMTQASIFALSLFLAANSQSSRSNGKISTECVNGPGWKSDLTAEAGAGPQYTFYNMAGPQYAFQKRDLTLDLDWHLLSWTHLVQRLPFTPMSLTYFHHHQFPSPIPPPCFLGRNV